MNSAQYTYVDQINSNLVCCICRTPFIDPAVTTTCSHTFCRECIASALEVNPQCPVDRSLLTIQQLQPAATIVRNLVDELLVECPHAAVGCGLTCQRQLLLNHLASDCQYVQVQCSQEGCSHAVLRKDLGQHAEDCIHRLVECQACGRDVKLAEMNTHYDECPATEITCIHCNTTLPRASLTNHHATCDHIPVACAHSAFGCPWTGPRHLLGSQHLASCPYEAIKGFFAVHVVREKALEVENAELRRRVDELERVSRSHQRDLERAKLRLGPWFKAPSVERDGETASVDSTGSGEPLAPGTSPNPRPVEALRRRLSVPFNSAVFGVEDPLPAPRRSTISATDVPPAPEGSSSRNASFDDPYAGFANPTVHPILSNASGPSPFYLRAHSNYAVAPLNLGGSLESTLNSLRSSIVSLSGSLDSLERKQDIMLTTETLRMHEDVASLRAIVHGLRMQVHNIMMDRNTYFTNRTSASSPSQISPHMPLQPSPSTASTPNLSTLPPSMRPPSSAGGTSYTVSHYPHSHHLSHLSNPLSDSESHSEMGDGPHDTEAGVSARYFNQRPPVFYNLSPNIVTTVRRGPEGKL